MKNNIINKIESIRKDRKLTQLELTKLINVPTSTYSRWILNDSLIDVYKLIEICKILNISSEYLLGLSNFKFNIESLLFDNAKFEDDYYINSIFAPANDNTYYIKTLVKKLPSEEDIKKEVDEYLTIT